MSRQEALDSLSMIAPGRGTAGIGESWLQGRSAFGGLQAALGVRAMRSLLPEQMPLRTLQTTFIAPLPAGEVRIEASLLRAGKSTVHVEARLFDGEQVASLIVGWVEALGAGYLGGKSRDILPYVVVLAILVVRPHGIFGTRSIERL